MPIRDSLSLRCYFNKTTLNWITLSQEGLKKKRNERREREWVRENNHHLCVREHKNICGNFSCDFVWSQLPLWNKSLFTAVKLLKLFHLSTSILPLWTRFLSPFIPRTKNGRGELSTFIVLKHFQIEITTSKRWIERVCAMRGRDEKQSCNDIRFN